MSEEFNPYQAPQSEIFDPSGNGSYRVQGKSLICGHEAVLPPRCIKTNEAISGERMKTKTYYWTSSWIYLLLLLPLPWPARLLCLLLAHFIFRKRIALTFGLSSSARERRFRQHVAFWIIFLGSFASLFAGINWSLDWMVPLGLVGIFACVISLLWIGSIIRPVKRLSSGEIAMRGCGPDFLASLEKEIHAGHSSDLFPQPDQ